MFLHNFNHFNFFPPLVIIIIIFFSKVFKKMAAFNWGCLRCCFTARRRLLGSDKQLMQKSQRLMMQPTMIMTPLHRHAIWVPSVGGALEEVAGGGGWGSWGGNNGGGGGGGGGGMGGGPFVWYPAGCHLNCLESSFVITTGNWGVHPNNPHPHDHQDDGKNAEGSVQFQSDR